MHTKLYLVVAIVLIVRRHYKKKQEASKGTPVPLEVHKDDPEAELLQTDLSINAPIEETVVLED